MARQVFRYKRIGGRPAPIVTVGIRLGASWLPVDVYVDSGAAYTLLHARIAEGVGFDFRSGDLIYSMPVIQGAVPRSSGSTDSASDLVFQAAAQTIPRDQ